MTITGLGGAIELRPFEVNHGAIDALGFRIGPLAYLPDVARMSDDAWREIDGADTPRLRAMSRAAAETVDQLGGAVERTVLAVEPFLMHMRLGDRG